MLLSRAVLLLALAVGTLVNGASLAEAPYVTRVFYLQGMEPREAVTLLRRQVQVRQIAEIRDRNLIVVADVAERVERSESLLRERDAVLRANDPHEPLNMDRPPDSPMVTRVFRIKGTDTGSVMVVLRAIYQMRDVTELAEENGVEVNDALSILDASEALLRELDMLAEAAELTIVE